MAQMTDPQPLLTPTLIKAARALLSFDQATLAERVGLSRKTVAWTEISLREKVDARRRDTLELMRKRLEEDLNVEFRFATKHQGEGVFLKKPAPETQRTPRRNKSAN
jgi:DNA-binding XRE family transcriptional regulator